MKKIKPGPPKGRKHIQVKRSPLGEKLYRTRKAHGLTQEQLGARVGLSKRMIAHYEAGSKAMTVESLEKISKALEVTVSQLMSERAISPVIENSSKPSLRKRINILSKLPVTDQKAIFRMIDNASQKLSSNSSE